MLVRARALSALNRTQEAIDALDRLLAIDPTDAAARQTRDQPRRQPAGLGRRRGLRRRQVQRRPDAVAGGPGGIRRQTAVGAFSFTGSQAERYDERDEQYEFEAYPRLRPGTYLYLDAGWSSKATLYPGYRAGAQLYQALGRGFEGVVRLQPARASATA